MALVTDPKRRGYVFICMFLKFKIEAFGAAGAASSKQPEQPVPWVHGTQGIMNGGRRMHQAFASAGGVSVGSGGFDVSSLLNDPFQGQPGFMIIHYNTPHRVMHDATFPHGTFHTPAACTACYGGNLGTSPSPQLTLAQGPSACHSRRIKCRLKAAAVPAIRESTRVDMRETPALRSA